MAWPLYEFFGMPPDVVLDLKRDNSSLAHLSAKLLENLTQEFARQAQRAQPRAVLVHGDTSTALMAAMAAFYLQLDIGHIEAGLRTHDRYDPFPEEKNRELIGRLARWHFAPTAASVANLRAEGVVHDVHQVGNTAIDAARWGVGHLEGYASAHPDFLPPQLDGLRAINAPAAGSRRMLLVTAHRRENWGEGITQIAQTVRQWLLDHPDDLAVWPVHANPAVADAVHQVMGTSNGDIAPANLRGRLFLCPPVDYPALLWLMQRSWLILTDSGGIQEESAALNKPVLVLRKTTERPELIETGRGVLVGTVPADIRSHIDRLAANSSAYGAMIAGPNPFGDGHAGERIARLLAG